MTLASGESALATAVAVDPGDSLTITLTHAPLRHIGHLDAFIVLRFVGGA